MPWRRKNIKDKIFKRVVLKWIRRNWELVWPNEIWIVTEFSFLNVHLIMRVWCKETETLVVSLRAMTLTRTLFTKPSQTASQLTVTSLRLLRLTAHAGDH